LSGVGGWLVNPSNQNTYILLSDNPLA